RTSLYSTKTTSTTSIYTLSLHDALPIFCQRHRRGCHSAYAAHRLTASYLDSHWRSCYWDSACWRSIDVESGANIGHSSSSGSSQDRKSTRLNSSHRTISYAVFFLRKKET